MRKRSVLRSACVAAVVIGILFLASPAARGATYTWQAALDDWSVASSWGGTLPNYADYANIANGGAVAVTQTGASCGTLSLGSDSGDGNLLLAGGELIAWNYEYVGNTGTGNFTLSDGHNYGDVQYVGYSGTGSFTQSGGRNQVGSNYYVGHNSGQLFLGFNAGSSGAYQLSGTGYVYSDFSNSRFLEYVGYSGTGSFTQTGGGNGLYGGCVLYLGYNAGGVGTYNLSGTGASNTYSEYIGYSGTGSFTQSGGGNGIGVGSYGTYLGYNPGSSGTYNLSGNSSFSGGTESVGYSGAGSFTQSGGTNLVNSALYIGYNPGSSGTYCLAGASYLGGTRGLSWSSYVGYSGAGSFTQSGGTNLVSGTLYIGYNSGSSGTYQLSGTGALSNTAWEYIGYSGTGSFSQSGGANVVSPALYIGYNSGSSGAYNLSGGSLFGYTEAVGTSGTGSFTQSGGTNSILGSYLSIGWYASSSGTYSLSGGYLGGSTEYVGEYGPGSFIQSGGSNVTNGIIYIGYGTGSKGTYSLSDSGCLSSYSLYVGYSSTGSFTQSGGQNSVTLNLDIGGPRYNGLYILSGTGNLAAGTEYVGPAGTFTQSGGTNSVRNTLYLEYGSGGSSTYNLSGSGYLSCPSEYVGGFGSFTQSGGTNNVGYLTLYGTYNLAGGLLTLGSVSDGSGGTFNLNGGNLQAAGNNSSFVSGLTAANVQAGGAIIDVQGFNVTVGQPLLHDPALGPTPDGGLTKTGTGTLTLSGQDTFTGNSYITAGTLVLGSSLALQNSTLDTSGSGSLSFGSLKAVTLGGLQGSGSLALRNSSSAAVSLSVGGNNTSTTFSGSLVGSGSLVKIGAGALALTGSNTYTGPTMINQGELVVDGSLVSLVTVSSGGMLGGTGSLSSVTVNAGGHLAPGDSPGTLILSGSLTLMSGAVMDFQLATPTTSDMVLMPSGSLALNYQLFSDFNFTPLANFAPGEYTLIDAGSISGSLGASSSGTIDGYSATLAIQDNNLVLNVVPEPSTLAMLAGVIAGLMVYIERHAEVTPEGYHLRWFHGTRKAELDLAVRDRRLKQVEQADRSAQVKE